MEGKRGCVEPGHADISLARQCELIGLNRSSYYYQGVEVDDLTLGLMRLLDEQYTRTPFYGVLRMTAYLRRLGHGVNSKRVRRLLRLMGLGAVYPKPNTSQAHPGHKIYPYLLRGVDIDRPYQVWSSDITYIRLGRGFVYLMAVIDWFSRYVLDWSISTTLEADFCVETLERVLSRGRCEIFNTDQGAQFTSPRFTDPLIANGVQVSMDGRGRALGQYLCRASLALGQVREGLFNRAQHRCRGKDGARGVLYVLQHRTAPSSLGVSNPS